MIMAVTVITYGSLLSVSSKRTEKYFHEMNSAVCYHICMILISSQGHCLHKDKRQISEPLFTHLQLAFFKPPN